MQCCPQIHVEGGPSLAFYPNSCHVKNWPKWVCVSTSVSCSRFQDPETLRLRKWPKVAVYGGEDIDRAKLAARRTRKRREMSYKPRLGPRSLRILNLNVAF